MLSIISMNRAGLSDGCLSVKVDFEFDNASTLPERVITVSGMSYIIAKDSTAKNTVTNVNYKYNGSKWVKVTETVEPVTGGTITDNGDYTITSNEYTGLSDISVDVPDSSTFMDKTITENNTYVASDDGVSGYSSVTVNVSSDPSNFTRIYTTPVDLDPDFSYQYLKGFPFEILKADDGIYNLGSYKCSFVFATPVKKIIHNEGRFQSSGIFTPSADYDGFYDFNGNPLTVASGSSTVTPNDKKGYIFKIYNDSVSGEYSVTIKKATGADFRFTIE